MFCRIRSLSSPVAIGRRRCFKLKVRGLSYVKYWTKTIYPAGVSNNTVQCMDYMLAFHMHE